MIDATQRKHLIGYLVACLALGGVGLSTALVANEATYKQFDGSLEPGRVIWMGTCEGCHAYGIAGAPVPMKPEQWQARLEKPIDVLYQNAVSGFFGPGDTYMPPKGGNEKLSETEVMQAVDYMLALANYYIEQKESKK